LGQPDCCTDMGTIGRAQNWRTALWKAICPG
jgi:hypothetical protein